MIQLLGLVLISFMISSFLLVPFIDFLFYIKKKKSQKAPKEKNEHAFDVNTPIHNKLLEGKDLDTPIGGGILLIVVVLVLSLLYKNILHIRHSGELYILLFTLGSFGLIGLIDDVKKIFLSFSGKFRGLRARYLFLLQLIGASIVAALLYFGIGLNNIYLPIFGNIILGFWYIPLAIFVIIGFSNAYNISDGLDGLSSGLLLICLIAFLALASTALDLPLSIFIGVWIGTLIAYLYFNVYPARIYLGDAGAFGFGATLAVVGLLSGKLIGLAIIGAMYIIIVTSSFLQILSKRILKRKLFPVAPVHMYFKYIGWEEPKIVTRFWLAGSIFAVLGLWLALLSR